MSFIHATLVGHFDLRTVGGRKRLAVHRPIEQDVLDRLLAKYGPKAAACVWLEDGYAHCQWAPGPIVVSELAEELARETGAVLVDWNHMMVIGPPEAVREWERVLSAPDASDAEPGAAADGGA
jgi:hypothetical protein